MRVAAAQERSHRCAILSVSRGLRRRRTNENAQVGGGNLSEDMSRKLKPLSPGEMIAEEFLKPLGMSNYRLAKEISVPARRIGELLAGKRAITRIPICGWRLLDSVSRSRWSPRARDIAWDEAIDRDTSRRLAIVEAPTVLDRCRSMVNAALGYPSQDGGSSDGRPPGVASRAPSQSTAYRNR